MSEKGEIVCGAFKRSVPPSLFKCAGKAALDPKNASILISDYQSVDVTFNERNKYMCVAASTLDSQSRICVLSVYCYLYDFTSQSSHTRPDINLIQTVNISNPYICEVKTGIVALKDILTVSFFDGFNVTLFTFAINRTQLVISYLEESAFPGQTRAFLVQADKADMITVMEYGSPTNTAVRCPSSVSWAMNSWPRVIDVSLSIVSVSPK